MIFNKPFGRYRLVKKLATGGMAEVFLGLKHGPRTFDKLVALKSILAHRNDDEKHVEMFYNEARIGAAFRHQNVVHVFDAQPIENRHTMVMEFVPGQTVQELVERLDELGEPLEPSIAMAIAGAAALGLHHAHELTDIGGRELGLVHRDVSPHNLLVGFDGIVKVFDFGVAVAAADGEHDGQLAGKTAYMSPEQCRGRKVDRRSDVFSLGIVLHELVTGQRLFRRDNHIQSIRAITEEPIPRPSELRPGLDDAIDELVMRALARKPSERYETALAFHKALLSHLSRQESLTEEAEIAALMETVFREEIDELRNVVDKILRAPLPSDTGEMPVLHDAIAAARQSGAVAALTDRGAESEIIAEEGGGFEGLKSPRESGRPPTPTPSFVPQASAAVTLQLQRTKRLVVMLSIGLVVALLLVVGAAALYLLAPPALEPDVTATVARLPIDVSSTPEGAEIFVNGANTGKTTPATLELPANSSAIIELQLEGFSPFETTVVPRPEQAPPSVTAELESAESEVDTGGIRVVYTPADAQLFIDGELEADSSPALVEGLAIGVPHTVSLRKEGFQTQTFPITIDSTDIVDVQLELAEAAALGTLEIRSSPSGASVRIDGEEVGETPIEGLQLVGNQQYTVEVRRGARSIRNVVFLQADETRVVDADLTRRAPRRVAPSTPDEPEGPDDESGEAQAQRTGDPGTASEGGGAEADPAGTTGGAEGADGAEDGGEAEDDEPYPILLPGP